MNLIFSYILLIILVLASWNGYIILWGLERFDKVKRKRYSTIWHKLGWVIRFMIACLILWLLIGNIEFIFSWKILLIFGLAFLNVSWTLYDLTINAIRKLEANQCGIWYIDNKGTNAIFIKFLGKTGTWIFRGILIILNVILWLI